MPLPVLTMVAEKNKYFTSYIIGLVYIWSYAKYLNRQYSYVIIIGVIDTHQNSNREAEAVQDPVADLQTVKPDDLFNIVNEFLLLSRILEKEYFLEIFIWQCMASFESLTSSANE